MPSREGPPLTLSRICIVAEVPDTPGMRILAAFLRRAPGAQVYVGHGWRNQYCHDAPLAVASEYLCADPHCSTWPDARDATCCDAERHADAEAWWDAQDAQDKETP